MEWAKNATETDNQYTAFEYFLKLDGTKRNVANAHRAYMSEHPMVLGDSELGQIANWYDWAKRKKWKKRAEAYDNYINAEVAVYQTKEQVNDIVNYKKNNLKLAKMLTDTGNRLIVKVLERLVQLDSAEIAVRDLGGIIKSAIGVVELSQKMQIEALALDELVLMLSEKDTGEVVERHNVKYEDNSDELLASVFDEEDD